MKTAAALAVLAFGVSASHLLAEQPAWITEDRMPIQATGGWLQR